MRATSILLVAVIITGCMILPVSASEVDNDNFLNVLDYAFTNETGTNSYSFTGSGTFSYTLPLTTYVGYIDMVICTGTTTVKNIEYRRSTSAAPETLYVVPIGNRYLRIYGTVVSSRTSTLYFDVTGTTSSSFVVLNVVSLRVGRVNLDSQEDNVSLSMYDSSTDAQYATYYANGDPALLVTNGKYVPFSVSLWCLNWERYDYFDFYLCISASSINSIYAVCSGYELPVDISYIDNGGSGDQLYNIMIRIYFTGLDRTGNDPMVYLTGNTTYEGGWASVISAVGHIESETVSVDTYWFNKLYNGLRNVVDELSSGFSDLASAFGRYIESLNSSMVFEFEKVGLSLSNIFDTLSSFNSDFQTYADWAARSFESYFSNIEDKLDRVRTEIIDKLGDVGFDIKTAIDSFKSSVSSNFTLLLDILRPDTTSSEELKDEVEEQASELDEITDVLDDVTTPEIVQDDLDINIYIDSDAYASFTSVITEIFKCNVIFSAIMMSLIFALGAYLLYGKR